MSKCLCMSRCSFPGAQGGSAMLVIFSTALGSSSSILFLEVIARIAKQDNEISFCRRASGYMFTVQAAISFV